MQITEQIIQRIARQVFNQMFPSSLRQSGAVISGSGGSVQYAVEAGHAASADNATYATSAGTATTANAVAWANVSDKPAQATRWPAWSEVTSKPTSKTIWGQTYLDASSVFQNVSGALSDVTDLTMSGKLKIGSIYIEAQTDYIEVYKLDENNNKIAASLCAYGGVSALGVGTGGGGGGGTSLQAVWTAMANATDEQINISHLAGTNGALATMTGYTTSGKNYAVQKDASNHLYVNVPWTDHYAWSDITGKPTKLSDFTNDVVSASVSGSTLTVTIGGTGYSLTDTNTWRPVVDNLTSTDTDKSLSANQGYQLANGSARDSTKLPLAGGTMTGVLTLKGNQYSGNYGMNANNSDIVGLNALEFADLSDDYTESIRFPRTAVQGVVTYDTIRAADGTFYFGFASGSEFITMTGSVIKHARTDGNDVMLQASNTNGTISLLTSTNRGVYDSSTSTWLIATNGTDTWLSRGKVGIGTTSPSGKLHVAGGTSQWAGMFDGGTNSRAYLGYSDGQGAYICSKNNDTTYLLALYKNQTTLGSGGDVVMYARCDGNVGIGTSSPSYKLHVDGDIYATGGVSCLSDIRQKNVSSFEWKPAIEEIASAPIARYTLKADESKRERIGSIAQYWRQIMPQAVMEGADGVLSMDYGTISLVSVIALAREVRQLRAEVTRLKNFRR